MNLICSNLSYLPLQTPREQILHSKDSMKCLRLQDPSLNSSMYLIRVSLSIYSLKLFWCSLSVSRVSLAGKLESLGRGGVGAGWCGGHPQPSPQGRRLIQGTSGLQPSFLGLYTCSSAHILIIKTSQSCALAAKVELTKV